MRGIIHLLITVSLAVPAAAIAAPELESDDDKVIYVMGIAMGRNFPSLGLTERETEILYRGLSDQLAGRELAVEPNEYGQKVQALVETRLAVMASEERDASSDFVKQAAAVKGARTTESGLIYLEASEGTGEKPAVTDSVTVHYTGTLRDGSVFDSSHKRGEPASFALNRVIPCWTEALQRMKVGGKATIVCPSDIAYGDRGAPGGLIKPGAALKFEVELLSIDQ
ncbi:MAG: FKBP-type peptidyl-prolyl cis-trans isomerase [Deltaproteobacteria bacterium]|nr:FKBP-type peptidyl-prolyl cis-trans isomerase [Deltaproteobacteria bacterium]MBW2398398.1 FKBP-type peptidyl-prolyl cis-trans isomerase [Deltaproteobacteria bacterium]MBW2665755.1 FKBP-type peptidyl-prolyl cis-trans isomerase [Deltaproteobacteria bacterium]